MTQEWIEIIRREAANVVAQLQMKSTLVATSYDPDKHAVKGMLMPQNVESDWISVGAIHIGNGFGILVGPKCGSAGQLDGDQFDIEFERGDPHNPIAKHRVFSVTDKPPGVQSGEMLLMQEGGNQIFFAADKTLTIVGQNGSVTKHHPDGRISMTPADGQFAFYGADPDDGKSQFDFIMTASGPSTNTKAKYG